MARKVDVNIGVKNKMASGMKSVKAAIRKFSRGVSRSMRSTGLSFRRVAAVGIGSFVALIKYGNAFRNQMAEVKTMLGDDKTMLPKLTKQVRELSAEFGLAKETLAKGLYQALSAGIPAGNAIEFLTVASRAAVGGVTDVATAVDGLTSVMNAYGIEAARVSEVSDLMFTVVKEGKINFEELSQNIGNIAPFAKVAGVGIEDLSAMIATLVKVDKPERAMTSLRQAMVYAAKEGKPLLQVLEEFEGKSLEDLLAAGVTQKSAAGIAIMSSNMAVLRKEMKLFKNTAGAANAAFEDVKAVRHWNRVWQAVLTITSQVGEKIDTVLGPAINKVTEAIKRMGKSEAFDAFIAKVETATKNIIGFFELLASGGVAAKTALVTLGDILILSFVSGAQQAANIIAKGIKKAWEAQKGKIKDYAKYLIPGYAVHKAAQKAGTLAGGGGEQGIKDLFDRAETNRKRSALIDSLSAQISSIGEKKKPLPSESYGDIGKYIDLATGKARPLVAEGQLGPLRKNAPKGWTPTAVSAVSAATSMLSAGDLFTQMQFGKVAKTETELGELKRIYKAIQDLIKVSGGVE